MKGYVTVGLSMLAGAALLEVALVPGLMIGGAAVLLAPQLPNLRRHLRPLFKSTVSGRSESTVPPRREAAAPLPVRFGDKARLDPARFGIKQAIAKTITFRIIVTTLDFTTNYVVIGELATAAGLSAFALVVGPLFYLAHETAWNYSGADVGVPIRLRLPLTGGGEVTISRALAKTITFRTIATAIDFTTNYVVVGDLATAAGLSAFAFVVGPFVYLGHEMLWDRYGSSGERTDATAPTKLLPAPA
jgi:uncharacterized membrane protein